MNRTIVTSLQKQAGTICHFAHLKQRLTPATISAQTKGNGATSGVIRDLQGSGVHMSMIYGPS